MVLLCSPIPLYAQELRKGFHKDEVSAAFLYNLIGFTTWPNEKKTITVCLIGVDNHLYSTLKAIAKAKSNIRNVVVTKSDTAISNVERCHILYFGKSTKPQARTLLAKIKDIPVLTVGEEDNFLDYGGIIRFVFTDTKLRMEAKVSSLDRSGVKISSFLLGMVDTIDK